MRTLSLRGRLTLWYTLALVVAVCLFGAEVLWEQRGIGVRRLDQELDGITATAANIISEELHEGDTPAEAADEAHRQVAFTAGAFAILNAHGAPLIADWGGLALAEPLPSADAGSRVWTVETPKGPWRVHAAAQDFDHTVLVLLVARSLNDARREQHEVLEAMEVAIPLVLLLGGGGGFWLASVGLRPISGMADRAGQMALTGMDDLGYDDRKDELGQLARAFNGLVARLRAALCTQQQFMADASHELRTPVSVMRAASEVALSRDRREESEYRESLTIVGDQARRLSRLVENMLVLARADAGGYPLQVVDLYLDEVVADCCRTLQPLSAERQVTIRAGVLPETPFRGDEDSPASARSQRAPERRSTYAEGGTVSIDMAQEAEAINIRVADSGPGIPPADQARIFDRFVQLDHARRGAGTGLGLPIARWIAQAHNGALDLERSSASGSTFRIVLRTARSDTL